MENKLQVYANEEFGKVRVLEIDDQPWFVGKDVAYALGYERATKAIQDHVDEEDKDGIPIQDSIGRQQNTPVINESGLYSLILSSKLPKAKKFKRWVTSEVLPSIRRHGAYITEETLARMYQSSEFASELLDRLLLGLGSCRVGIFEHCASIENSPLLDLFSIPKEKKIVAAVIVGYPKYDYKRLVDRNPLDATFIE